MNSQQEIDAALHLIGTAQPSAGLERRVLIRLDAPRRGATASHFVSAAAIAASITIAAVALAPPLRDLALRGTPAATPAYMIPRAAVPQKGGFGTASAVRLPPTPVPVQPTPVNQGRGHARSGRAMLPAGARIRPPHGVAVPGGITVLHPAGTHISAFPVVSAQSAVSAVR